MKMPENLCRAAAKWAALIEDKVVPAPRRVVPAGLLRAQRGLGDDLILVRDHNSPNDVVLEDHALVDLAEGNVFYALRRCDVTPRDGCTDEAKRAWFIDDRPEITILPAQTGALLRQLFALNGGVQLFRDYESPVDAPVGADATAQFADGPVFYTRRAEHGLQITVNARAFTEEQGVRPQMTGVQIAALVYPENPRETRVWLTSGAKREVGLDETIRIEGCETFDVVRKEVTGGFEAARVKREVAVLSDGGAKVTVVESPGAVIYHDLGVGPGLPVSHTDVLVTVPSGYPGHMLDGAYLPEGSPLLGRVKGQPQDAFITALGRRWQLVSYHPHNGGGAESWNPTRHGFHTYLGEVLSWLYNAR